MHDIQAQLRALKAIRPDGDFVVRARAAMFAETDARSLPAVRVALPKMSWNSRVWAWSGAAMSAALVMLVAIVPALSPAPTLASLDAGTLADEYGNLPINVSLKEIDYGAAVEKTVASAVEEITVSEADHLHPDILEEEAAAAEAGAAGSAENVDALIEQVIK